MKQASKCGTKSPTRRRFLGVGQTLRFHTLKRAGSYKAASYFASENLVLDPARPEASIVLGWVPLVVLDPCVRDGPNVAPVWDNDGTELSLYYLERGHNLPALLYV